MKPTIWFNDHIENINSSVSPISSFIKSDIQSNYKNVLSSQCSSQFASNLNLPEFQSSDDDFICCYKYEIVFNSHQRHQLKSFFLSSKMIYDFCVDVWKLYKNITTSWELLKDVIFFHLYRNNNNETREQSLQKVIDTLMKKQEEFNIENSQNQNLINNLKLEANKKYKIEMDEYKKLINENKKLTVKKKIQKPKKIKIKIEKIKKPKKPKGVTVKKPAPDNTLKMEIKSFCINLSNARNKAFEQRDINNYDMKYKNVEKTQTIYIPKESISKKGIFPNKLGELSCKNYNKIIKKHKITKDCKLQYDKILKKYYIYIPLIKNLKDIKNRKKIVALDPGEKTFMTYFSNEEYGKLGDNMRIKILNIQKNIKQYQSALSKNKNKNNTKIKNKKHLKRKIKKNYEKIKGYVNEIHKKSAKYLCENYENIIIPKFETKPMISNKKYKDELEKIKAMPLKENAKDALKRIQKKKNLSDKVKFVLSSQSHYKFKKYLEATAKRYRTKVYEVDEHYTSQTCTECGKISNDYKNRIKICVCGAKIDRDINGSRNIFLKSIEEICGDSQTL